MRLERTNLQHGTSWLGVIALGISLWCEWTGHDQHVVLFVALACYLEIASQPTRIVENGR